MVTVNVGSRPSGSKPPVGYVVVEIDYQYNDEYYYSDTRGGYPLKIFAKREDAEQELTRLTLEAYKKRDLGCYIMDGDWHCVFENPDAAASKYALNLDEPWNIVVPSDEALLKDFVKDCSIEFYRIIEVPRA
jgi:hypothetical protein